MHRSTSVFAAAALVVCSMATLSVSEQHNAMGAAGDCPKSAVAVDVLCDTLGHNKPLCATNRASLSASCPGVAKYIHEHGSLSTSKSRELSAEDSGYFGSPLELGTAVNEEYTPYTAKWWKCSRMVCPLFMICLTMLCAGQRRVGHTVHEHCNDHARRNRI